MDETTMDGASESAPNSQGGADETTRTVQLPPGDVLDVSSATDVTRAHRTVVVLVCGPVASGKTTLITSIYEQFQWGPFADYLFAGSRTLLGFESRCRYARIASDRDVADTERTKRWDQGLLHLRVRTKDLSCEATEVLLPDVSGEVFEEIENSDEACRSLSLLRRAEHIAVLVDGGAIVNHQTRQESRTRTDSFLRRCVQSEMLGDRSQVHMIFAKWDLVVGTSGERSARSFVEDMKKTIRLTYGPRLGVLRFWEVAARPTAPASSLQYGHGMAELFKSWLEHNGIPQAGGFLESSIPGDREFDRFRLRR